MCLGKLNIYHNFCVLRIGGDKWNDEWKWVFIKMTIPKDENLSSAKIHDNVSSDALSEPK